MMCPVCKKNRLVTHIGGGDVVGVSCMPENEGDVFCEFDGKLKGYVIALAKLESNFDSDNREIGIEYGQRMALRKGEFTHRQTELLVEISREVANANHEKLVQEFKAGEIKVQLLSTIGATGLHLVFTRVTNFGQRQVAFELDGRLDTAGVEFRQTMKASEFAEKLSKLMEKLDGEAKEDQEEAH